MFYLSLILKTLKMHAEHRAIFQCLFVERMKNWNGIVPVCTFVPFPLLNLTLRKQFLL
jgi:hypothetical protein